MHERNLTPIVPTDGELPADMLAQFPVRRGEYRGEGSMAEHLSMYAEEADDYYSETRSREEEFEWQLNFLKLVTVLYSILILGFMEATK